MKKRNALIVVTAIMLMVVGVAAALVVYHFHFRQKLVLVTAAKIQVYYDKDCTQEFKQGDTLDWGQHDTTDTLYQDLWIKNTGGVNVTLRFDWQREHPWMEMSWNYTGRIVQPGEVECVKISLELPDDIGAGEMWWDGWFEAVPA